VVQTGGVCSVRSKGAVKERDRPRVIATASCDLLGEVEKGRFSAGLYYRLSTLEIDLSSCAEADSAGALAEKVGH
jgi:transcriptional regulator of acetoin/glycerol metabolism